MERVSILKSLDIINDSVNAYEGERPFLSTGNLNVSAIDDLEYYTFQDKPSRANLNVKSGDLILARMKDTLKVKMISDDEENIIVSTGFLVLRPKKNLDNNYLFHVLKSSTFQNDKNKLCTGATQKAINNANFAKIKIPLPDLATQKRIADILDKAAEIRDYNLQLIAKYEELKQSIFLDMFGDPVKNEKGWKKDFLGNCFKNGVKCGPFGSALKKHEFVEEGVPVWNMDNIQNYEFVDEPSLFVTKDKAKELDAYRTENGDIIISRAGTVGKMCIVNSNFVNSLISTNLIRLSLDEEKILPIYFVLAMRYFSNKIGKLKKGSEDAFTHMGTGVLTNLEIHIPSIKIQREFEKIINKIDLQIFLLKSNSSLVQNLFNSLTQKAFSEDL